MKLQNGRYVVYGNAISESQTKKTIKWQNMFAFWWSATNYSAYPETTAIYVRVDNDKTDFPAYGVDKSDAQSIRCIKD